MFTKISHRNNLLEIHRKNHRTVGHVHRFIGNISDRRSALSKIKFSSAFYSKPGSHCQVKWRWLQNACNFLPEKRINAAILAVISARCLSKGWNRRRKFNDTVLNTRGKNKVSFDTGRSASVISWTTSNEKESNFFLKKNMKAKQFIQKQHTDKKEEKSNSRIFKFHQPRRLKFQLAKVYNTTCSGALRLITIEGNTQLHSQHF